MSTKTASRLEVDTRNLEKEIGKLSDQVKLQNKLWNRFVLGLVAGVGTALGATVIATIILLLLGPILRAAGLDIDLQSGL